MSYILVRWLLENELDIYTRIPFEALVPKVTCLQIVEASQFPFPRPCVSRENKTVRRDARLLE